jgi:hypothetical protein
VFRKHLFPHRLSLKYQRGMRYPLPSFFQVFQLSDMMEFLPDDSLGLSGCVFIFKPNRNSENVYSISYPPPLEIGILSNRCLLLFVFFAVWKANLHMLLL